MSVARSPPSLGVSFDFSSSRKGLVKVGITTSRVQKLTRVISDVLSFLAPWLYA